MSMRGLQRAAIIVSSSNVNDVDKLSAKSLNRVEFEAPMI